MITPSQSRSRRRSSSSSAKLDASRACAVPGSSVPSEGRRAGSGSDRSVAAATLPALERLLEQHEAQLASCRQSFREDLSAASTEVKDTVDCSVDHFGRSVNLAVLQASSTTVRGIQEAMQRLQQGTYGTCADCDAPIPAARLKVLPFAERCRDCQHECDMLAPGFKGDAFAVEI